jgi:hypothetical protein
MGSEQARVSARLLAALAGLCFLLGCSKPSREPPRGSIWGQVTLDGRPVPHGLIRLIALDPEGINCLATIAEGRYELPEGQGPTKGKYRVEFSVPSAHKRKVPNPDLPGQFLEEAEETLPPKYHRDSQMTIDYDPAQKRAYDFALTR